ncbi:hypothetical protein GCM10027271_33880 [Saccharopolyspora gloriosae]
MKRRIFPAASPARHPEPIRSSLRTGTVGAYERDPRPAESAPTMNFLTTLLTSVAVALLEGLIVHAAKTAYQRMLRTA